MPEIPGMRSRKSVSPETGDSSREASVDGCGLSCPACGSGNVHIYNGSGTERIVLDGEHFLASCLDCKRDCKVVNKQAQGLSANDLEAMRIRSDRACPSCGYNLRSLSVGHPCPECGSRILFPRQAYRPSRFAGSERRRNIELIYLVSASVVLLLFHKSAGVELVVPLLGGASVLHGILGLHYGSLRMGWSLVSPLATGWAAKVWGIVFVAIGLALIVVSVLVWRGILR